MSKRVVAGLGVIVLVVCLFGCATPQTLMERAQGYYEKAQACYEEGNFQKAVTLCRRAISCRPEWGDVYFLLGRIYWDKEDYTRSLRFLRKAGRYDPDNVKIWIAVANVHERLREFEEAINAYGKIVRIDDTIPQTYAAIGECYYKLNKFSDAVPFFEKAVSMGFDNQDALYMLAVSYMELGDRESALSQCNILRQVNPVLADELLEFIKYKNF